MLSVNSKSYVIRYVMTPWFFAASKSRAFEKILKIGLIDLTTQVELS